MHYWSRHNAPPDQQLHCKEKKKHLSLVLHTLICIRQRILPDYNLKRQTWTWRAAWDLAVSPADSLTHCRLPTTFQLPPGAPCTSQSTSIVHTAYCTLLAVRSERKQTPFILDLRQFSNRKLEAWDFATSISASTLAHQAVSSTDKHLPKLLSACCVHKKNCILTTCSWC